MNKRIIDILMRQQRVREFRPAPIAKEIREQIFAAALHAPNISGLQSYSIIVVEDLEQRQEIANICNNNPTVKEAPLITIFCADSYRLKHVLAESDQKFFLGNPLMFLLGTSDAIAAAQNMVVAAESYGLGTIYEGNIFNDICRLQETLSLPAYVFPVAMVCCGYPAMTSPAKPPIKDVFHWDHYRQPTGEQLKEFKRVFSHLWDKDHFRLQKSRQSIEVGAERIIAGLQNSGFITKPVPQQPETHLEKPSLAETLNVLRKAQRLSRKHQSNPFSRINILYKMAFFYLLRQQPERTLKCFSEAILQNPTGAELYCCLGSIHQYLGNGKRALTYFQKAITLQGKEPQFHLWLGEAQARLGQLEKALDSITNALELDGSFYQAWLVKGRLLEKLSRLEEALDCYQQADSINPRDPNLLNNIAVLLLQLKDIERAKDYCNRALQLRPRDPVLLANKGLILSKMNKFREAEKCYRSALRANPENVDLLNNHGYCLMQLNQYQEALAIYELALELKPGLVNLLENKASCLTMLNRLEEALACYQEILKENPHEAAILNNMALCLVKLGRYRQALAHYQRALDIYPKNLVFLGNIADCLIRMERYQEALLYYEEGLKQEPENRGFLSGKGICLDYLGRQDEALDCYNNALRLA